MKKKAIISVVLFIFSISFYFGQDHKPELLKFPDDWRFERIDFPPAFAPDLRYKGFEELRFGPGMFDKKSKFYFTYAFAIRLTDIKSSDINLKDFLYKYFKGLIKAVSKQKNMKPDLSKLNVEVRELSDSTLPYPLYFANLMIIDPFTDGQPLALSMEISRHPCGKSGKDGKGKDTCYFFIASPKPKKNKVWDKLNSIRQSFLKQ